MMFTLPSARRLLLPTLTLVVLLTLLRLLADSGVLRSSQDALLQAALERYLTTSGNVTVLTATTHPRLFNRTAATHDRLKPIPPANPLIRHFTQCPLPVNPHTSQVRLEAVLYNVSLHPPPHAGHAKKRDSDVNHDDEGQQRSENTRFFNPAIIPLPYWSHPAKYVLVSRFVTAGFHQESHICLADICLPPSEPPLYSRDHTHSQRRQAALPPDTRACKSDDYVYLGPGGGMRCLTPPLKINIPPTPAEKCEGKWLAFPDIPGFHDPRVFWSGKGEPLILVNSASRYGCVGLWIVDLRKIYPTLERVLSRELGHSTMESGFMRRDTPEEEEEGKPGKDHEAQEARVGQKGLGGKPLMSYPHLTEVTRNPRSSRASVEKNWILWFPNADEAYVQYDLLGHPVTGEGSLGVGMETPQDIEGLARLGLGVKNISQAHGNINVTGLENHNSMSATTESRARKRRWVASEKTGGRTFAKLTGNGFTTRNLTHPEEQACFSVAEGHFKDALGKVGHWHQGSNTLRLILCTRTQARTDTACQDMDDNKNRSESVGGGGAVENGRSVHFAIVHRKFTNEWDLPLRYERYVVLWEGREPFQLLGVSRFPLSMKNEWVKPWSEGENWPSRENNGWNTTAGNWAPEDQTRKVVRRGNPDEMSGAFLESNEDDDADEEEFDKSSAYFTYTPSLAWTWRPHSATANQEDDIDDFDYLSQLGTGYLGDEVLVGIGLDDVNQAFTRVKVVDLLQCLRLCPGVTIADGMS